MVELKDLIQIYDDTLEENVCDFLISMLEQLTEKQEKITNDRKPNLTQINLTQNREITEEVNQVQNYLIQKTFEYRNKYYEFVDERVFPQSHAFEQYLIKRYLPNENEAFDAHVDVKDHETSRRFLSFFWYLNDVEVGGDTAFTDLIIKPKKGRLIVFPPLWMFPHKELDPISNPKYILSTYLHYK